MKFLIAGLFFVGFQAQAGMDQPFRLNFLKPLANACFDDINCPPGSHCISGRCQFQARCFSDAECPVGKLCMNGVCQ